MVAVRSWFGSVDLENDVECRRNAGARGMAHSGALELARLGIRVNTVAPGSIRASMITDRLSLGEIDDVAPPIVYLTSDESQPQTDCTLDHIAVGVPAIASRTPRPERAQPGSQ